MSNISIEQRNAQKLYNLINIANINSKNNKDIYFFLKCNVKVLFNKLQLSMKDKEILSGHCSAFTNELTTSKWDLRKFDPKKYQKFLNDLFDKIDFRKVDTEFMFKCRDLLEISPIKDDLYNRRMEYFDKKLPKIGGNNIIINQNNNNQNNNNKNTYSNFINNVTKVNNMKINTNNNTNNINNNINQAIPINPFENINEIDIPNNSNNNNNSIPVNPFSDIPENSNPYININQQNFENNNINNNTNDKGLLRSIPKTGLNQVNINNNIDPYKPKQIPEFIKQSIIKELEAISGDLVNTKINDARKHSVEVLLYFKQIFPDN